eukprot:TRINITY_DN28147_c0_g1_i1.p1 TRINITY_DN28147_c0_g1~~TRINITY_DN28147_c0_g1_i1.p1  ORF type:complete len:177 (+),score=17.29 TRINITY_DN28147_c0_g1_i1:27-533(+)
MTETESLSLNNKTKDYLNTSKDPRHQLKQQLCVMFCIYPISIAAIVIGAQQSGCFNEVNSYLVACGVTLMVCFAVGLLVLALVIKFAPNSDYHIPTIIMVVTGAFTLGFFIWGLSLRYSPLGNECQTHGGPLWIMLIFCVVTTGIFSCCFVCLGFLSCCTFVTTQAIE